MNNPEAKWVWKTHICPSCVQKSLLDSGLTYSTWTWALAFPGRNSRISDCCCKQHVLFFFKFYFLFLWAENHFQVGLSAVSMVITWKFSSFIFMAMDCYPRHKGKGQRRVVHGHGNELEYTPVGKSANVFLVHFSCLLRKCLIFGNWKQVALLLF